MADDLDQLRDYSTRLPVVADYYSGTPAYSYPLIGNVILFSRLNTEFLTSRDGFHYRFVLIANLSASGTVVVDHVAHHFVPGSALLIFPHQFHSFPVVRGPEVNWFFVTFEATRFDRFLHLKDRLLSLPDSCLRTLSELARFHIRARAKPSAYLHDRMVLLANLAVRDLAEANRHKPSARSDESEVPPSITAVTTYVYAHAESRVPVGDLARQANLSESRLRAVFRQHTGISLGKYVQGVKLNKAREKLGSTGLSIKEIADSLGFGSVYAFSRAFKKGTGVSPRAYRKRLLASPAARE
jgi:AraC-like DNA-binding protein